MTSRDTPIDDRTLRLLEKMVGRLDAILLVVALTFLVSLYLAWPVKQ